MFLREFDYLSEENGVKRTLVQLQVLLSIWNDFKLYIFVLFFSLDCRQLAFFEIMVHFFRTILPTGHQYTENALYLKKMCRNTRHTTPKCTNNVS